jgi:TolA-binding protein
MEGHTMRKSLYALTMALALAVSTAPVMAEETSTEEGAEIAADENTVEGIEAMIQKLEKQIAELKQKLKELRGENAIQEGDIVYQDDMVIITYNGISDEYGRYDIMLTAENLTDKKIRVQTSDTSINGYMTYQMFSVGLEANKKSKGTLTIDDSVEIENIEDLQNVETKIQILDDTTYEELLLTDPITINFNIEK